MYTYSEDLFMTAFFTLITRGAPTMVLVAGGGVTSAGGAVSATAMETDRVTEAAGSVSISWRSGSGGEACGLQTDNVSVQQYQYLTIQQGSIFILEDSTSCAFRLRATDDPAGPKAEFWSCNTLM
jgi:hypothetical protein